MTQHFICTSWRCCGVGKSQHSLAVGRTDFTCLVLPMFLRFTGRAVLFVNHQLVMKAKCGKYEARLLPKSFPLRHQEHNRDKKGQRAAIHLSCFVESNECHDA